MLNYNVAVLCRNRRQFRYYTVQCLISIASLHSNMKHRIAELPKGGAHYYAFYLWSRRVQRTPAGSHFFIALMFLRGIHPPKLLPALGRSSWLSCSMLFSGTGTWQLQSHSSSYTVCERWLSKALIKHLSQNRQVDMAYVLALSSCDGIVQLIMITVHKSNKIGEECDTLSNVSS